MNLFDLLSVLNVHLEKSLASVEVTGLSIDSREVMAGNVFVCIQGKKTDAHSYISEAIDRGAIAIVAEKKSTQALQVPLIIVPSGKQAYSLLAQQWTGLVWEKMRQYAVTGTTGKTTIAYMIYYLFNHLGHPCALIGTAGYYAGDKLLPVTMKGPVTTPQAGELHAIYQMAHDQGCVAASIEASSFGLSEERLYGMQFDGAVLSNLSVNHHIGFHGGWQEYLLAKKKLFHMLKKDGTAIFNADETYMDQVFVPAYSTLFYGKSNNADVRIEKLHADAHGISFELHHKELGYPVKSPLKGEFQAWNLASVFCVGVSAGFDPLSIIAVLEKLEHIPGRWEALLDRNPFTVVVDKANTAIAIDALSSLIQASFYKKKIAVFGNVGGGDYHERVVLAQKISSVFDFIILTLDDPEDEDIWNNFDEFLSGIPQAYSEHVAIVLSREEAFRKALQMVDKDDLIVLLGRGNQREFICQGKSEIFNDVEVMTMILCEAGYLL